MGQITLSRFRGDTTLGLGVRIFSTFFGGLVGLVMWCVFSRFLTSQSILFSMERTQSVHFSPRLSAGTSPPAPPAAILMVSVPSVQSAFPSFSSSTCIALLRPCSISFLGLQHVWCVFSPFFLFLSWFSYRLYRRSSDIRIRTKISQHQRLLGMGGMFFGCAMRSSWSSLHCVFSLFLCFDCLNRWWSFSMIVLMIEGIRHLFYQKLYPSITVVDELSGVRNILISD